MHRLKFFFPVLVVVLALSAMSATVAQATEGPFFKVCEKLGATEKTKFEDNECSKVKEGTGGFEKKRLLAGEKRTIEGAVQNTFVLKAGGRTIKCKKLKLKNGEIIGSTGKNSGKSKEVIEFEECVIEGNGAPCSIPGGKIVTVEVKDILDYPKNPPAKGDIILTYFEPPLNGSGEKEFTKITFEGAGCELTTTTVKGSVAAESWESAKKPVKIEETEVLGEIGYVNFPATQITKDFIENEGKLEEVKPKLEAFGVKATLEGTSSIKLVGGAHWGVFTK